MLIAKAPGGESGRDRDLAMTLRRRSPEGALIRAVDHVDMINVPTSTTVVPMSPKDLEARRNRIIQTYKERTTEHYEAASDPHGAVAKQQHKPLVNEALRNLRQVKRDIVQAEKEIRAASRTSMGRERGKRHSVLAEFWGRASAGQARADAKQAVGRRRDKELEPYRRLKLTIDDDLRRLMNVRDRPATGQ